MTDVPPPPENPFLNEQPDPYGNGGGQDETLDQGRPNVAASPGRVLMVLGIVGAVLLFLVYNIFSGGDKKEEKEEEKREVAAPVTPPPLPEMPEITAPPPIIPPSIPEPIAINPAPAIDPEADAAAKKLALERLHSDMLTVNEKNKISILGNDDEEEKPANSDPNSAFAASVIENTTEAEKVEATRIANLQRTIAQGRIIHATLESALNTDLPAPVRAIVSRDTYAEAGHEVLIPKGSRLIGVYNTDISGGQSRVFLVWTRVIRPDGVDVMLGSPLVDQIGQAGIGGQVDSKFQSIFSRAILSSIVAISLAIGSDEVNRKMGGESSTTTTDSSLGGSQTSGNAASTATVDALDRLGEKSDSFLDKFLELRPTILVDQGTPVNVFVNRDLIFPARAGHSTEIVN